jgi:hypothetical protein
MDIAMITRADISVAAGHKITLPRGAVGLINTTREPPTLTVSSARAPPASKTNIAVARKEPIHCCRVIVLSSSISVCMKA